MPQITASPALSRLRILDFSRVRAGPTCVRQFADFGADVIKIESPPGVDPNEAMGGPRHGPDMQNLHRNKRSMTLNLKLPQARDVLQRQGQIHEAQPASIAQLRMAPETLPSGMDSSKPRVASPI